MTRIEEHAEWLKLKELRKEFNDLMRDRHPHMCYTNPALSKKIQDTIRSINAELKQVKDGEPEGKAKAEKPAKAKKEEAKTEAKTETKVAAHEVKVGQKIGAKAEVKA